MIAEQQQKGNPEISPEEVLRKTTQAVLADLIGRLGELRPDESPADVLLRIRIVFAFLRSGTNSRGRS
jgi:hypothetical protein